jgi:hypothetical protein
VSWQQLQAIYENDRQQREFWLSQPPRACPHDGTPLQQSPNAENELFCPHDGYMWPRDLALPGEGGNG